MILPKSFYSSPTIKVAKELLGTFLVHQTAAGTTIGRIVETEAYLFRNDPACHAHRGKTKRNEVMFGSAGRSYVYFIYGMYHCFNVVTGKVGEGEAVLIRALEPIEGIDLMSKRRKNHNHIQLCNGPGKLVIAMGISREQNGLSLCRSPLKLFSRDSFLKYRENNSRRSIIATSRVGISTGTELPLRFYIAGNIFVSTYRKH